LKDLISIDLSQKDREAARKKLKESLEIFRKLGDPSGEAATLYDLASLDMENEDFDSAIEKFLRVLEIRRRIGDHAGEAATLHYLGMIDAHKGNVQAASEKFKEALKICQQTADKSGEASAFFQLGILAVRLGNTAEGMRLLALSGMILRSIGNGDERNVEPVVERMAAQIKYTQEKFAEMVREAALAYRKERGWGLVEAALGTKGR
jgi:tetratricopeptide (TPR) repeat protein